MLTKNAFALRKKNSDKQLLIKEKLFLIFNDKNIINESQIILSTRINFIIIMYVNITSRCAGLWPCYNVLISLK